MYIDIVIIDVTGCCVAQGGDKHRVGRAAGRACAAQHKV